MARLTKDERDAIRWKIDSRNPEFWRGGGITVGEMERLFDDIDATDEEILRMHDCADENTSLRDANDRLRTLARRLYGRAIEGDEFTDNDFAELRSFSLIDDDGLPAYDDEEDDQ